MKVAGSAHGRSGGLVAGPGPRRHPPVRHAVARLRAEDRPKRAATAPRVAWSHSLVVPGPAPRRAAQPRARRCRARATLLARDGSVLAESPPAAPSRHSPAKPRASSPLGEAANAVRRARSGRCPRRVLDGSAALAGSAGRAERRDRRAQRPGARARRPPARHARAASCSPGRRVLAVRRPPHPAPPCARTRLARRCSAPPSPRSAASSAGSSRWSPSDRPDPGGRGHRPRRPAAAGLDVQDVTLTGVLEREVATPHTVFPYATLRHARRGEAEQRQRRGMRRHRWNWPSRCRATRCSRRSA